MEEPNIKLGLQKEAKNAVSDIESLFNKPGNKNKPQYSIDHATLPETKTQDLNDLATLSHTNIQDSNDNATLPDSNTHYSNDHATLSDINTKDLNDHVILPEIHDKKDSNNIDSTPVTKKKRNTEIEFDFSLIINEPRKRSAVVVRYKGTQPPKSKTKKNKTNNKTKDDRIKEKQNKERVNDSKIQDEEGELLVCEICSLSFSTIKTLLIHKQQKHLTIVTFICALCSATFVSNAELIKHKVVHRDENRNFLCMICKTAFSQHLEYLKHKVTHENSSTYYCIECGKEFIHKQTYTLHVKTHYCETVDVCHGKYDSCRVHEHEKTPKDGNKIKCVECGKEVHKSYISCHMANHTGVKPFQCLYCGKGFNNANSRAIHTRIHTGENPYRCNLCHQVFRQQTDLNRHITKYHPSKPKKTLKCNVCGKIFTRKYILAEHIDNHNNTQKYACHICGKKINTSTGLKSHLLRSHTEGKNYKCIPCGLDFKVNQDLKKHLRNKTHINNQYGYDKRITKECK